METRIGLILIVICGKKQPIVLSLTLPLTVVTRELGNINHGNQAVVTRETPAILTRHLVQTCGF